MNGIDDTLDPLETEAEAVATLAFAAAEPSTLNPAEPQAIIVPAGAKLELPDLSAWRETPVRATGVYKPATVASLISYVKTHHAGDSTTVWVHPTSGRVEAILDDNGAEGPGYGQHRAVLQLLHTPEWNYWLGADGRMMGQVEFAEHVEGGLQEIEQPDAADVLEMAQSFHAKNNVTFRQSTRLATGEQQLQYDEEVTAKAGHTGQLTIPTQIVLKLAPFVGEQEVQLVARFRFRITSGHLQLGYKIEQPHRVIRDVLDRVADTIGAEFERTYVGEPPHLSEPIPF